MYYKQLEYTRNISFFLPNKIPAGRPEIPPGVYKNGNFRNFWAKKLGVLLPPKC